MDASRVLPPAPLILALATLFAFGGDRAYFDRSSVHDKVSNETAMDIFGVMLTFHDMVALVQDGRFRQPLVKACAALLMGWRVYALPLAFIVFGLAGEIAARVRRRRNSENAPPARKFSASPLAAVGILAAVGALAATAVASRHRALWVVLALMRARGLWGERAVAAAGVAAVAIFAVSACQIQTGDLPGDDPNAETRKAEMADLDAIREKTRGKTVAVYPQTFERLDNGADYYLAGSDLIRGDMTFRKMSQADFIVSRSREHKGFDALTPENREIFLHAPRDMLEFYRAERRRVESGPPAARSDFDVYLDGGDLYYIKEPCAEFDTRGIFFMYIYPVHFGDIYERDRALGYNDLGFEFAERGTPVFDGACMMKAPLPDYPVRAMDTGQRMPGESRIWSATINPPLSAESVAHYETLYAEAAASGEPLIVSDFDVYLEEDTLTYIKEPCAESDTRGRFFLSVHPVRIEDLPPSRLDIGHDGLNFNFALAGVLFGGKCVIRRELPGYEVAAISTGQFVPEGGRLWSGEAAVGD